MIDYIVLEQILYRLNLCKEWHKMRDPEEIELHKDLEKYLLCHPRHPKIIGINFPFAYKDFKFLWHYTNKDFRYLRHTHSKYDFISLQSKPSMPYLT